VGGLGGGLRPLGRVGQLDDGPGGHGAAGELGTALSSLVDPSGNVTTTAASGRQFLELGSRKFFAYRKATDNPSSATPPALSGIWRGQSGERPEVTATCAADDPP